MHSLLLPVKDFLEALKMYIYWKTELFSLVKFYGVLALNNAALFYFQLRVLRQLHLEEYLTLLLFNVPFR